MCEQVLFRVSLRVVLLKKNVNNLTGICMPIFYFFPGFPPVSHKIYTPEKRYARQRAGPAAHIQQIALIPNAHACLLNGGYKHSYRVKRT